MRAFLYLRAVFWVLHGVQPRHYEARQRLGHDLPLFIKSVLLPLELQEAKDLDEVIAINQFKLDKDWTAVTITL